MAVEGVELGPAVMPGEVSVVPEAYVVLRGDTEAEVAVLDSHLRFTRSIAGRGGRAQALVAHRASGKMFMSDDAGICELPFAGGPPARFDGSSACMRALETNRSATELVAHSKALGLCRFDLQRRELTAQVKLHVHTDRLEADLDHEMVVLPQTRQAVSYTHLDVYKRQLPHRAHARLHDGSEAWVLEHAHLVLELHGLLGRAELG